MSKRTQANLDCPPTEKFSSVPTAYVSARGKRTPTGIPAHLPIWKQVIVLSFWPMLEQVMNWLVWFVDTSLAGYLPDASSSKAAINAIGAGSYWIWLMTMILGAVGVGGTAIISRAIGAGRFRVANLVLGQVVMLLVILGVIAAVAFSLSAGFVGHFSSLEGESLAMCEMYTRYIAMVSPAYGLLFGGAACLRGAGQFKAPFVIMVVVNVVNIVVSWTLVNGIGPIPSLGLVGIIIGTVAAWTVGALLMIILLLKGTSGLKLQRPYRQIHRHTMRRVFKIGIPNMVENLGWWAGGFMVLWIVGQVHNNAVGAHIMTIRLEGLSFLPGFAMSMAVGTMVGQYLGVGDVKSAKKAVWVCWAYGSALMVLLGITFMWVPHLWVSLMTNKPSLIAEVAPLLFTAGWGQLGFSTAMIINGALRGAGDTRTVTIISFTPLFLYRVPAVFIVGMYTDWGLLGVWIVLSSDLYIRGTMVFARFLHGGWTKVKV